MEKKKKKRPAWPAGAVQSATCGALCAANHKKDHNSDLIFFVSDAGETVLWCRCRKCGVAASPPHGDKQLPAVTTKVGTLSDSALVEPFSRRLAPGLQPIRLLARFEDLGLVSSPRALALCESTNEAFDLPTNRGRRK